MEHLAFDLGIAKSTVCETILAVENTLIQEGTFRLQGNKALCGKEHAGQTFVVDVTECPIERPPKSKTSSLLARKSVIR